MKRILLFLLLGAAACGQESGVSPGNSTTYVRYFNGGNNDVAVSVMETSPDKGLLILATTSIQPNELKAARYKIELIKTDASGNMEWQKFYPDFGTAGTYNGGGYKAGGMYIGDDGTIAVAGTDVQPNGFSNLLLLTTDSKGGNPKTLTIPSTKNTIGTAINKVGNDYLLLGTVVDAAELNNMVLNRVKSTLDSLPSWSNAYGAGQVSLVNKLFLNASKTDAFWGGTVARNSNTDLTAIRLVNLIVDPSNQGGNVGDLPFGNPAFSATGTDFCKFGETWAFTGSTNQKFDGSTDVDFDILYMRVNADGSGFTTKTFPIAGIGPNKDGSRQSETGNSICTTRDGGLLLLGTVNSTGVFGRGGSDYYLIKINAFGTVQWTEQYGSKFDDSGVQVIQASDGGNIVLGTTNLANLKTIMLMKTTEDGKIQ